MISCKYYIVIFLFSFIHNSCLLYQGTTKKAYYFSAGGNDNNNGSAEYPFKTLAHFNTLTLNAGDSVLFKARDVFIGNLVLDSTKRGSSKSPVVIASYGGGAAIIDGGNGTAISVYNTSFLHISRLNCKGAGRKNGNTKAGISLSNCYNILIDNIDVSGFQKSGLQIYNGKDIRINKVTAHDNGAAGIGIEGEYKSKRGSSNIQIVDCAAINNPGDPANLTNHSGNGIVAGHCTNVLIDHCTATNNGWDMPRKGNGPVGIWCYEADSVIIQHCISYRNKTSVGGADGGGFDLDGGVTNSIIQYCLSYENQGSGYCMFQYWSASPWHNNVVRYNISENDGLVSNSRAGIYVWNSSKDATQFHTCDFYNNTIYNSRQAAIHYSETSERYNFRFLNNIFIGKDTLIRGNEGSDIFLANDWYSIKSTFNANRFYQFIKWAKAKNKEQANGKMIGLNILPAFKKAANTTFTDVTKIEAFDSYKLLTPSLLLRSAIDLHTLFSMQTGKKDFNGERVNSHCIGACTNP